ncbi:MAG: hypothetical protein JNL01_02535 [Bdellovibrionales bacterium]|nr:hypothetical protein [Bdellovibrionales bacterium]
MFKNYLTFNFAISFERECRAIDLPQPLKGQLLRSSAQVVQQFTTSLHARKQADECRALFVALTSLRDCREILEESQKQHGTDWTKIRGHYEILHARVEQLCEAASRSENGQLRMLG